jgi:hypothetical protein
LARPEGLRRLRARPHRERAQVSASGEARELSGRHARFPRIG